MYGRYYMFTKCLWGGQEVLDIRDIIDSGKYEVKTIYFNSDDLANKSLNKNISINNGLLLFLGVTTYQFRKYVSIDFTLNIDGSSKKISTESGGGNYSAKLKVQNINKDDNLYSYTFAGTNQNPITNLVITKYEYPSSTDTVTYYVPTSYPLSIKDFPSDVSASSSESKSYYLNSLKVLNFKTLKITFDYISSEFYKQSYFALVYAIPK